MFNRIDRIPTWSVALLFALIGFVVFASGLGTPFQGDDFLQIVNAPPVHDMANIPSFFHEGTFYYGQPGALSGGYYRPLMTTSFAVLWGFFGANTLPFHLFQLLLHIASAMFVFSILRRVLRTSFALPLALIWLVHPVNSQTVFAIPYLQDALFFFFGVAALWVTVRFTSLKALIGAAALLFLSLLSKETGVVFVPLIAAYLFWFDRRRLYAFLGVISAPVLAWLLLRIGAVGILHNPNNAPIDNISLPGRLVNMPSVVAFYLTKFLFPLGLASGYYWVNSHVTIAGFLIPLVIDVAAIGFAGFAGPSIRRRGIDEDFRWYQFFSLWTILGLAAHLQIIPLDETVSETYFYFPMVGLLGMIGVAIGVLGPTWRVRVDVRAALALAVLLVLALGIRSAIRGTDWHDAYTLASHDIVVSPDDYNADINIAIGLAQQGDIVDATAHARHAVQVYPTFTTYNTLGNMLTASGQYDEARQAYMSALSKQVSSEVYENLGVLSLYSGSYSTNLSFFQSALQVFPQDGKLWYYLAILENMHGDNADAKTAIANAAQYGSATQQAYDDIMNNIPIHLPARPGQTTG